MRHKTSTFTLSFNPFTVESGPEAYEAVKERIDAVPDERIVPININVRGAVAVVLEAAPKIEKIAPQLQKLPSFDMDNARYLATYARALFHVDGKVDDGSGRVQEARLQEKLAEAVPLRRRLLTAADMLAQLGLVPVSSVDEIRAGSGHIDTASDLDALGTLFRSRPELRDKTPITREEVARAPVLSGELLSAIAARARTDVDGSDQQLERTRVRAFTLLVQAYDQCRRAIAYLRWDEGDAEEIAPSLFVRSRRRRTLREQPEGIDLVAPTETPAPAVAPTVTPAPKATG